MQLHDANHNQSQTLTLDSETNVRFRLQLTSCLYGGGYSPQGLRNFCFFLSHLAPVALAPFWLSFCGLPQTPVS
eukprot:1399452-Rhodomonas_salina.3